MGLHQAGFDVTGVDIEAQRRYPFRFIQADALDVDLSGYDLIWASPPCQAHTSLRWMHNAKVHRDLIGATRDRLERTTTPWIIENVPGAPLQDAITLCGTMFGLGCDTAELRRHRRFETSFSIILTPICTHGRKPRVIGVYGGHGRDRRRTINTRDFSVEDRRLAMGIDWMTGAELSQAIPPAYSRWLGEQAMRLIQAERSATVA